MGTATSATITLDFCGRDLVASPARHGAAPLALVSALASLLGWRLHPPQRSIAGLAKTVDLLDLVAMPLP
jgi:hypothetical protein